MGSLETGMILEVEDRLNALRFEGGDEPFLESHSPGRSRGVLSRPLEFAEIVNCTSASDQKDPLLAQGGKGVAHFQDLGRKQVHGKTHTHHRDVRIRIQMKQGNPDPMIEQTFQFDFDLESGLPKAIRSLIGDGRRARA